MVVTIIWGATFSWMKIALDAAEVHLGKAGGDAAVGLFLAFRFTAAAIALPLILPAARRNLSDPRIWRGGAVLAFFVVSGFALQMVGLQGIDPATSAFLTSLYVLFTAIITIVRDRRLPRRAAWLGIALATFGAGFIGGPPHLAFGLAELLTVLCGLAFAGHIVSTDVVTRQVAPLPVTTTTFVLTALACLVLFGLSLARSPVPVGDVLSLLTVWPFLYPAILCSLLGTVGVLSLLNLYQRELTPIRAAILFSLEPVWAAFIALGLGQAQADTWFIVGATTLLAGNIVMELAPKSEETQA